MATLKLTKHDMKHIEETAQHICDEYDFEIDGDSEVIMTSIGYVDVDSEGNVTVHGVIYRGDEIEVEDDEEDLDG